MLQTHASFRSANQGVQDQCHWPKKHISGTNTGKGEAKLSMFGDNSILNQDNPRESTEYPKQ
jgi:hypothetical protein